MTRDTRRSILLIVTALVAVGVVMIYSASAIYSNSTTGDSMYYLKRHLVYIAIGIALMLYAMSLEIGRAHV